MSELLDPLWQNILEARMYIQFMIETEPCTDQ